MALDFNSAHKAYANAVMTAEAHKAFGKRGPSAAVAKKASWSSSVAADKAARGKESGYAKSWSTYTADRINDAIEGAAKSAIKTAYKDWKKNNKGKKSSALDVDLLVAPAMLGLAVAAKNQAVAGGEGGISRRHLLTGMGAFAAVTLLGTTAAFAKNAAYISTVKRALQSYTTSNSPAIIRGVGAGIRG
ncbi:hypothetical protein WNZ14_12250 [Hoeflea sp. AS60]|uniref:hypothetical protein n=1 Tax=Hoeflea sp. AS60 TaxID=3135780 RepID=UPI00316CA1B3